MKNILSIFLLLTSISSVAQEDTTKARFLHITTEFGVSRLTYTPQNEPHFYRSSLRVNPFIGYFFNDRWSAGLTGSYGYVKSNYDFQDPAYGIGGFVQYLLPLKPKSESPFMKRFYGLGRFSYHRTNYYLGWDNRQFTQVTSTQLVENALFFDVGLSVRIFKQLYFQNFFRYDLFLQRSQHITHRAGLSYHFHR